MIKQAVFLDRDGVLNDFRNPVNKPGDLVLFPWTGPSIRRLNEAGYLVFVVTNQGGIERGYFTPKDLRAVHTRLELLLQNDGARIDEIVYCPEMDRNATCRKPNPGMLQTLADKYDIAMAESWMVGDRADDVLAGKAAGCRTIKLISPDSRGDFSCRNLEEAVDLILKLDRRKERQPDHIGNGMCHCGPYNTPCSKVGNTVKESGHA